jgi:hypothetical protein
MKVRPIALEEVSSLDGRGLAKPAYWVHPALARRHGREPDAAGKKETTMALLDSGHRLSTARPDRETPKGTLHPAISLAGGFGFIVVTALIVHVAMAALL